MKVYIKVRQEKVLRSQVHGLEPLEEDAPDVRYPLESGEVYDLDDDVATGILQREEGHEVKPKPKPAKK